MKKYLSMGVLASVLGGFMASCQDHETSGSLLESKLEAYDEIFTSEFGQIDPNHTWGFGSDDADGARTRAAVIGYSLSEQNPSTTRPTGATFSSEPSKPTVSFTVPANTPDAPKNLTANGTYKLGNTFEIENPQNQDGVTFYVVGNDVKYNYGTSNNATRFIVTKGAKLTLNENSNYINVEIFLDEGATLVLPNNVNLKDQNKTTTTASIYISSGSTVSCLGDATFDNGLIVLNDGGTIDAKGTLSVNTSALLYNKGVVEAATISQLNTGAEIVNTKSIKATNYNQKSGSKFLNQDSGEVFIKQTVYIDNQNGAWQNDGTYTCGDFHIENTRDVYNNCKLTVTATGTEGTGTFSFVKNSAFVLNANNSVKADKMEWGIDVDFYMGNNSLLWVVGELKSTTGNKGYGLHGEGTAYSILKAGSITYETANQGRMNYWGNLYVDTDRHFEQGFVDYGENKTTFGQPYYYFDTTNRTVMFKFLGDDCPITSEIPSSKCYHGYSPSGTVTPGDDTIPVIGTEEVDGKRDYWTWEEQIRVSTPKEQKRVMCEDLGNVSRNDIDFNDVVFDAYIFTDEYYTVTKKSYNSDLTNAVETSRVKTSTSSHCEIVLLAAGGTLPLTVAGIDVHGAFGTYTGVLVNTITSNDESYFNQWNTFDPVELKNPNASAGFEKEFNYPTIKSIPVIVFQTISGVRTPIDLMSETFTAERLYTTTYAPHAIAVPIGTKWAKERVNMKDAWTDFPSWVQNQNNTFWTGSSTYDNLYHHAKDTYTAKSGSTTISLSKGTASQYEETSGTQTIGGYNGTDPVLSRRRH